MSSSSKPHVATNVDVLDDVAGHAIVFGREIAVHHPDGETYRMLLAVSAGSEDPAILLELYEGVQRCCPELTPQEVMRLTPTKVGAILAIAQAPIANVETQFPNGAGPGAKTETPPA